MPKYIDADVLKSKIFCDNPAGMDLYKALMTFIDHFPAADVTPIVHAHWVDDGLFSICSNCCKYRIFPGEEYDFVYCPRCGAKMDESVNNDA